MEMRKIIIETLKREVVPAMGCTEPVAVALGCAKARELIYPNTVEKVEVFVSPNIYKNGLCVGIPHTGEVGLEIAAALGVVGGISDKELRVLEGIGEEEIHRAKDLLRKGKISLGIKDVLDKIYVEVAVFSGNESAKTIIRDRHNQFIYMEKNGEEIFRLQDGESIIDQYGEQLYHLSIREIIREIEKIPPEEISFMLEGLDMNEKIAAEALKNNLGMGVGIALSENIKSGILSDDLMGNAMMLTAAGADARMSGITMPVMSSNGSGNNGLTAILPIVAYRKKFHGTDDEFATALAISHILTGYVKSYIGRLSAICGCGVAASTGSSAAIAWLMGGNEDQIDGTIKNMVANISGMICDGAKVGCALKLATAASTAIQSAILAMNDKVVPAKNGIVAESAEETIRNLGRLGVQGMTVTDGVILEIMKGMQ